MKIRFEIGDVSSGKTVKWFNNSLTFADKIEDEKNRMYNFLLENDNCIIDSVDMFLLYALNNGILAHAVQSNPKIDADDEEYHIIPKLDPNKYRIFEIDDDGVKANIQNETGSINHNYFNSLMGNVMDDFYTSLVYLESDKFEKGKIK